MHRTYFIAFLLFFSCQRTSVLNSWKSYPIPSTEIASSYNHYPQDWIVFKEKGELQVTIDEKKAEKALPFKIDVNEDNYDDFGGKKRFIATDDGYLISFYQGEFGGTLWWF